MTHERSPETDPSQPLTPEEAVEAINVMMGAVTTLIKSRVSAAYTPEQIKSLGLSFTDLRVTGKYSEGGMIKLFTANPEQGALDLWDYDGQEETNPNRRGKIRITCLEGNDMARAPERLFSESIPLDSNQFDMDYTPYITRILNDYDDVVWAAGIMSDVIANAQPEDIKVEIQIPVVL